MRLRAAAAAAALGLPPARQSSNSNKGCRTGFENDTFDESSSVILRTPHACGTVSSCAATADFGQAYHERPRDVASKRAGAEQKTARRCDLLKVQSGEDSPPHELEIEVDCLIGEPANSMISEGAPPESEHLAVPGRVHHRTKVSDPRRELASVVLLPAERRRSAPIAWLGPSSQLRPKPWPRGRTRVRVGRCLDGHHETPGRRLVGRAHAVPPRDDTQLRLALEVSVKLREDIPEWPAGGLCVRRRIGEDEIPLCNENTGQTSSLGSGRCATDLCRSQTAEEVLCL